MTKKVFDVGCTCPANMTFNDTKVMSTEKDNGMSNCNSEPRPHCWKAQQTSLSTTMKNILSFPFKSYFFIPFSHLAISFQSNGLKNGISRKLVTIAMLLSLLAANNTYKCNNFWIVNFYQTVNVCKKNHFFEIEFCKF